MKKKGPHLVDADRWQELDEVAAADLPPGEVKLRQQSLATAVHIIANDLCEVREGRPLRYNEMVGAPWIGDRRLEDADVTALRLAMEERLAAPDKNGNPAPLRIGKDTAFAAVELVARRSSFHPVRDYLRSLKWDGTSRIERVAELLGAEPSPLNQTLIRKWFVGAARRPLQPGCRMQFVLVLVGPQGGGKSTALRRLADPWFSDTALDVGNKDAYAQLREAWITEWAELEALKRARDAAAIKTFITSQVDKYRPAYGRLDIESPRSGVIVGTTNESEFLVDETGHRRFWPITVGTVDLETLTRLRDALWAEAVAAADDGEEAVLDRAAEIALAAVHQGHEVSDAWAPLILEWAEGRTHFTVGDVLEHAIGKPKKDWTKADQMRVGAILLRAKFEKFKVRGVRLWRAE